MQEIHIVKSGILTDFVGWEWLNLRAFTDLEKAMAFADTVIAQIKPEDLDEKESVQIESLTLED